LETRYFSLIEFQEKAQEMSSPKKLFELWAEVCRYYDRGQIGKYELDEMKSQIWPRLHRMAAIRLLVDAPGA